MSRRTEPGGALIEYLAAVAGGGEALFPAAADQAQAVQAEFKVVAQVAKQRRRRGVVFAGAGPTCEVTATLKEITFSDDHTVYAEAAPCDYTTPSKCWGSGAALGGVDWTSVGNPDHPICYTRGASMRVLVRIEVTASSDAGGTAILRVVGPDGITGEETFALPCGTDTRDVNILTDTLLGEVRAYEPMALNWSVLAPGATQYQSIGTSQHNVYVTYGAPVTAVIPYVVPPRGDDSWTNYPTKARLSFLCNKAATARNDLSLTDGVRVGLDADPPNDPPTWPPPYYWRMTADWGIMHPFRLPDATVYVGECDEQTHFMDRAVRLVGGPAGLVYNTWPSPLGDCDPADAANPVRRLASQIAYIYWDIDNNGVVGDELLMLRFDFAGGAGTNINAFEGSIGYPWIPRYYSVWPSHSADTECWLLWQLRLSGIKQCWALDRDSADPNNPDALRWICIRDPNGNLVEEVFPDCVPGCP